MENDNVQSPRKYNRKASVIHFLVILFGMSSWIGINGIFVQTPMLVNTSPEGWALPAYLVLVVQIANFGPLIYTILQYFQYKINEPWWILSLLVSGTFAMGLLSFFYSEKTSIAGQEYSLVLYILTFFCATVGCFSSLLFMPYFRNFNESFLISYFIGEGLSGVLPSIVALIQGVGDNAECIIFRNETDTKFSDSFSLKFPPNEYFLFIFIILFLSLTAFAILEYSSLVHSKHQKHKSMATVFIEKSTSISHNHYTNDVQNENHYSLEKNENGSQLTKQVKNYLYTLLAICSFCSNGFFPSIQSYSCLPYGNIAYKLSITFAQFANPLACLLAFWLKLSNIKVMNYISIACLVIGSYVTYLALMSPSPPLQGTKLGIFLVIISWTLLIGLISYLKLIIVSIFRKTELPKILFNVGVIMQIGSASGAIFSFATINFTDYFQMHNNCALINS